MKKIVQLSTSGLIAALMLVCGFTAITAQAAQAGPAESITLSPVNKHYQFDADSLKTDELTIVNDGQLAYDFILYARPYSIRDEAYAHPDFTSTTANADAYKWVQFDQTRYHIKPGQTLKVGYTVRVPKDAAPGGHYGVLFAETQPSSAGSGNVVARKKRVGMVIYATVNGGYKMAGKNLGTNIPLLQFRTPLSATSRIQNDGNSDFTVKTEYRVTDLFGSLKYSEAKEYPVLPESKRQISFAWNKAPWFGLYRAEVKTSFLSQDRTTTGYVLMAPRWLLVVVGLAIAGGVLYAVLRRRR